MYGTFKNVKKWIQLNGVKKMSEIAGKEPSPHVGSYKK